MYKDRFHATARRNEVVTILRIAGMDLIEFESMEVCTYVCWKLEPDARVFTIHTNNIFNGYSLIQWQGPFIEYFLLTLLQLPSFMALTSSTHSHCVFV